MLEAMKGGAGGEVGGACASGAPGVADLKLMQWEATHVF